MRKRIKLRQILLSLGIMLVAGCAAQQAQFPPYASSPLPAVIKYPETKTAETETETEEAPKEVQEEKLAPVSRVSNLWEDGDLRMVLQDISAQTEVTIIYDDTVEGVVSLELKDIPLEKALKMVLEPRGYVFKRIDEDHYLVGSGMPGSPTALALSQTEIIVTNKPAEEVALLLSPDLSSFVRTVKDGHALSVTAPPEIISRIKKDLISIDSPEPQILIEVIVCETKWEEGRIIGIDWSQILDLSAQGDINFEQGKEGTYTGVIKGNLLASLNVMAQRGDLDIKANPRIVTMNGKQAEIDVTKEKYVSLSEKGPSYPGASYYWYPRFEARPISSGVVLKVTPRISREKEIILILEPEVSDMDISSNQDEFPIVNRRGAKTVVRVISGETVVIGGLHQQLERRVEKGLPVLSRIPVFNFFFRKERIEKQNTEVIIFVTPRILKAP